MRDIACMSKDVALAQADEVVELANPVGHVHRLMGTGLQLGEVEIGGNDQVEGFDFVFGQVSRPCTQPDRRSPKEVRDGVPLPETVAAIKSLRRKKGDGEDCHEGS